ncbi:MAG: HAMP domain-containing sensor histidine kinase [Robiginitomaculum sp.]|nr:HAMP domain-containing sensor histidine kinase [Robiginitomaculum sp.]
MSTSIHNQDETVDQTPKAQGSLGRRLLVLTVLFVMLAEIMIFLPSAAAFRSNWLQSRVQAARLAAIAVEVAPDMKVSDEIASRLLATAGIKAVRMERDGITEMILRAPSQTMPYETVDMRNPSTSKAIIATCDTLFMPKERFLRILDTMGPNSTDIIDVLVSESDLRDELIAFSIRTLIFSAIISVVSAALIYGALIFVFVRPMRDLSLAMARFQKTPEDPQSVITPSGRRDEIGRAEEDLAKMQNELRAALEQKNRLAALGEAVAKINHDLRNILTSAQLVSDRLATSDDPKVRTMGERLVRAIDRGVALCQSTLRFGKAEEEVPQKQDVDLSQVLNDAMNDACPESCAIEFDNGVGEGITVSADPDQLYRIILNLMRNAVQAMNGEGKITAKVDIREHSIAMTLADTGPGIPPEFTRPPVQTV